MSPMPATTAVPPFPTTPPPFCNEGYVSELFSNYSSVRSRYGTFQTTVDYRFEVCIGGQFTSVCDIDWDDRDAAVVCNDLRGYFDGSKSKCSDLLHAPYCEHTKSTCCHCVVQSVY